MGEAHAGRLDHVHLRVADLDASPGFYEAALGPLGLEIHGEAVYHGPFERSAPSVVFTWEGLE